MEIKKFYSIFGNSEPLKFHASASSITTLFKLSKELTGKTWRYDEGFAVSNDGYRFRIITSYIGILPNGDIIATGKENHLKALEKAYFQ